MAGIDIFEHDQWHPLAPFGLEHPFFSLDAHTIIYTWIALAFMLMFIIAARVTIRYPHTIGAYIVKKYVRGFMRMVKDAFHEINYRYVLFITTLFTFLIVCNCLIIVPTMEEPTKNLNTTIALALISFFYTQKESLRAHGLIAWVGEYFKTPLQVFGRGKPITLLFMLESLVRIILNIIIGCLLLPLELLGKFASVLSLSFRLFGNIFGGSVITSLWTQVRSSSLILQIVGLPINLLLMVFFGIFEGLIQAFVFTMLTVTYLSMATRSSHD